MITLEDILEKGNLFAALAKVTDHRSAPGVDGMLIDKLEGYVLGNFKQIRENIAAGKYEPKPVRRVYIPKEVKGQTRPLGIPTVYDRFVQQAVAQKLSEEYEPVFSNSSHGFRPGRDCYSAMDQALELANLGYVWVVDLDLRKFFDNVNHAKLLQILSERIKDGRVISLIHKMLRAPIMERGKLMPCTIGTPQGGCISPVLANILLDKFDKELERRGHMHVRYADDAMVFCRSRKAAERTLKSIQRFLEQKLLLRLNEDKTRICRITSHELKYLGFGFWREPRSGKVKARAHQKSQAKCRAKLRALTDRNQGKSLDVIRKRLETYVTGWIGYFAYGSIAGFVKRTDEWLRRRIRQIYWKTWKRVRTKVSGLYKLGLSWEKAWMWGNSRKSYWRIAGSWVLSTTLTNDFLREKGWICLGDAYTKVA